MTANKAWTTVEDFNRCTGKSIVRHPNGVRLRRGVTIADEIGSCNIRDLETVAGLRQARKSFFIEALDTDRAVLCPYLDCDRDNGKLDMLVNGNLTTHTWPTDRPYWLDRWTPVEIPAGHLKVGLNECVFRAPDDSVWSVLIENGVQPDRSAVSEDGGHTWRSDELGINNRADGEYMVRLWLDQHVSTAECVSEPFDLLDLNGKGIASNGRAQSIELDAKCDTPPGTRLQLSARSGPTPSYDPSAWSSWKPADGRVSIAGDARFVQWRALLETDQPSTSPVLKKVRVFAEIDTATSNGLHLTNADNPDLVRSSYRFAHMPADDTRGQLLNERWKLNDVVRDAESEFDAFLHLRQWVREQWEDGWNMGEIDFCPPWDAPLILELTSRKLSLGMCTHYATVMSQCSAALGLVSRTQIMRSHCINEVWSGEHGKWVAMDVGGDNNDETKFTYHFERNGVPLSALDCHKAWVNEDYDDVAIVPQPPAATNDRFEVGKRLALFDRFMISLRNDETTTMGPGEPEHGKGSYHYDGYLFWEDERTEPLPWFSQHTTRPGDLYWTVNRAKIYLKQGASADALEVTLDCEMPNFDHYEVRIDGGDWEWEDETLEWDLLSGDNRLDVRPVNALDQRGAVSWVKVRKVEL